MTIFKNHKVDVRVVVVGGREQLLVLHPGSVVIVPVLDEERIVLIRNTRYTIGLPLLELPAGTLDPNETVENCAARELQEETGYSARSLERIGAFYASPGFSNEQMHLFVARELSLVGQSLEPDENIEVVPMPLPSIRQAIRDGAICDARH